MTAQELRQLAESGDGVRIDLDLLKLRKRILRRRVGPVDRQGRQPARSDVQRARLCERLLQLLVPSRLPIEVDEHCEIRRIVERCERLVVADRLLSSAHLQGEPPRAAIDLGQHVRIGEGLGQPPISIEQNVEPAQLVTALLHEREGSVVLGPRIESSFAVGQDGLAGARPRDLKEQLGRTPAIAVTPTDRRSAEQHQGQLAHDVGVVRVEGERPLERYDRPLDITESFGASVRELAVEGHAAAALTFGARLEIEELGGVLVVADLLVDLACAIECHHVATIELEGFVKVGDGLVVTLVGRGPDFADLLIIVGTHAGRRGAGIRRLKQLDLLLEELHQAGDVPARPIELVELLDSAAQ